jgi:AraC-like DNA-binding protein
MYGEALSTALAVHLLREYGAAVPRPKRQCGGLPREKLVRAVEYIQDQLDADLTVSGIAQAVSMSPDHFTRLFKSSTGQTPYEYVVEARVRKGKELLTTGKFTISEAAFHVGFVDQSHLTRHFKRVFGLPPKRLLGRRKPVIVGWMTDGCYHYTGEGQYGDQEMKSGNAAILTHKQEGRALRLFKGVRGEVEYLVSLRRTKNCPSIIRTHQKLVTVRSAP